MSDDNTQCSQHEFEVRNTLLIKTRITYRPGVGFLFAFRQPDGAEIFWNDPLPKHEFDKLGDWVLREGEELEITIRRFPGLHKGGQTND